MNKNKEESWMILPDFPDYLVSNLGKIKKSTAKETPKGRIIKERTIKQRLVNGYYACTLKNKFGKKKTVYLHKAIASCYVTPPPRIKKRLIVVHKDGNKLHNHPDNLEWVTYTTFMKHEFESGRRTNGDLWKKRKTKYGPMGSRRPSGRKSPLTSVQKEEIYYKYMQQPYTLKKLALEYGCSISHVYSVIQVYKKMKSGK